MCSFCEEDVLFCLPSSVVPGIEPLQSFKDVSNAEKPNLFISKLNLCCVVFDFSDLSKNSAEKDIKYQTLVDLVEYFHSGPPRFTEPMIAASCKMFAFNLFRVFPPNYRSNKGVGENDEDEPIFDPSWSHLQVVYGLQLKFIASVSLDAKVAKKYVDLSFILSLLDLSDSKDPRERVLENCPAQDLWQVHGSPAFHSLNCEQYIFPVHF